MGFTIKKAEDRAANMVEWFAGLQNKITDFLPGSVNRTKLEAIAVEMESQDYQFYQAVKKAIPTAIYQSFDFTLQSAVRASGLVTFSTAAPAVANITIPQGTQVATKATATQTERVYETTEAATILAGQSSVAVRVLCTVPGTFGNTGNTTVIVLKTTINGISGVTNSAAFKNGEDTETEEARRIRFQEYINSLSRATDSAIERGAKTAKLYDGSGNIIEQVKEAKIIDDNSAPAGRVYCYIYNGVGIASSDLITETQKVIDGYIDETGAVVEGHKAAGIVCTVAAVSQVTQNAVCEVTAMAGLSSEKKAALKTRVESIISSFLNSFHVGQPLIYAQLLDLIMGADGAYNLDLSSPAGDVTVAANQIIVPGNIVVTVV